MDAKSLSYIIVGNGRWAGVIGGVLAALSRPITVLCETRRRTAESVDEFKLRIYRSMCASGAAAAWICVPPCPDLLLIVESAIAAGLHVVVEKPWLCPRATTEALERLARLRRVLVVIHFQYCFLDGIEALRLRADRFISPRFSGTFSLSRQDRLGLSALDNLGSHLLAVREYAVPSAKVLAVHCAYGDKDERFVRIDTEKGMNEFIPLMTSEPLIQRFVMRFEEAIETLQFPLDLQFASRVLDAVNAIRGSGATSAV